jgi:hypothetical protein
MKSTIKIYSFLLLAVLLFNGCKNPAENIDVLFDANVIQYKATIILKDASGATLPNLSISITGADAASIYDFSGTKQIYAPSGVITVGVTPKAVPTAGKPVSFQVMVRGNGYEAQNIPVRIAVDQFTQVLSVTMLKTGARTNVTTVVSKETPLAEDGVTTTATTVVTPVSTTVAQTTSVSVDAGTQMSDASGKVLTGGSLLIRTTHYDAKNPESIGLFPGGSLSAPDVVAEDGTTGSAFFMPAGFANVQMFVNGVEVKTFNKPIQVSIQVDPTFKPQATGQAVKVGDRLSIYSYEVTTGKFSFETNGTVIRDANGKLAVSFPISHLTVFVVGDVLNTTACVAPTVTFIAPWLGENTQPVKVEILNGDGSRVLGVRDVVMSNGLVYKVEGLPAVSVILRTKNTNGDLLGQVEIFDPCAGGPVNATLLQPAGSTVDYITLVLNVNCPGKGLIIVPNFDLFYKPTGDREAQYQLLGTAVNGMLKTTSLKIGMTYEFRATWKNQTKIVGKRTITEMDMSTVVGENDFLGTKGPEVNRALLIEACKGL